MQVLQFVFVLLQRVAGDEEAENLLLRREPSVLIPVRYVGQLMIVSFSMVFLENAEQPVLAGLGVALHFLRLLHRFIQYRH